MENGVAISMPAMLPEGKRVSVTAHTVAMRRKSTTVQNVRTYRNNYQLQAVQRLRDMFSENSSEELSPEQLRMMFLQMSTAELVDFFEHLIFDQSKDDIDEESLMWYIETFLEEFHVIWPASSDIEAPCSPQTPHRRRMSYATTIKKEIVHSREEGHSALIKDVKSFSLGKQASEIHSSEFIEKFVIKFIMSVYQLLTSNGPEMTSVLSNITWLLMRCEEEQEWWKSVQKRCEKIVGTKPVLNMQEFKAVLGLEDFMARRIFELTDKNNSGDVDQQELFAIASLLVTGDTGQKLRLLFDIYDENGDGTLDKSELTYALDMCLQGSGLDVATTNSARLTDMLFKKAKGQTEDTNSLPEGYDISGESDASEVVTFDELNTLLRHNPALYDNLNLNLVVKPKESKWQSPHLDFAKKVRTVSKHARIYTSLWVWIVVMSAITCAIAAQRAYSQITAMKDIYDTPLVIAKICGQIMNFLFSLVLLFNLKAITTSLKKTWIRPYLPLDDVVFLHKVTATVAFIVAFIHTIAHITLIVVRYDQRGDIPAFFFVHVKMTRVLWTGVVLVLLVIVITAFSIECTRNKSYNMFWISHQIFVILWYISLCVHAKNFIFWVIAPIILFLLEKSHATYIAITNRSVVEYVSTHENLTVLHIKKPDNFTYSPGDYVMVRIPEVARFQWRPFTISSGRPVSVRKEDQAASHKSSDALTLHIRKVGEWTGALYNKVTSMEERQARFHGEDNKICDNSAIHIDFDGEYKVEDALRRFHSDSVIMPHRSEDKENNVKTKVKPIPANWKVYFNGPFSTPSHDILKTEHAILVAGGIGITPFASILEGVIAQLRQRSMVCPCGCNHRIFFGKQMGQRLKRIDLFWLTRSQKSLGWFTEIFKELEEEQLSLGLDPPLVNVHLYLTGLRRETDMRGTFLQLALNTAYDDKSADMITGLRAQTKPGRPDWSRVIPKVIEDMNTGQGEEAVMTDWIRPKLYACGPAALCKDLRHHCSKNKIPFKEEVFG